MAALPLGRVIEIYGPESSGKTTLALHAVAEIQKNGGTAAFIDAEHALDPTYAAALGVDIANLLIAQPDTGEAALEIVDQMVRSTAVDIVVIDSVAALVPRAEIEGDMGDSHMGLQARLMSQARDEFWNKTDSPRLGYLWAPVEKPVVKGCPSYSEKLLPCGKSPATLASPAVR